MNAAAALAADATPDAAPLEDLAVAICTHDNIRTIERTLASIHGLAAQIVVVDSGSTDGTIEACRAYDAEVIERPWAGHVAQKQFAIDRCNRPWVLLLDSDEALEPDLAAAVRWAVEQDDAGHDGWQLNRKVWFFGAWLHHTYQPEWRLRLFRAGKGFVAGEDPHDRIEVAGRTGRLPGVLRHDSWADLTDMAQRQISYARTAARTARRGGTAWHILTHPPAAIFKQLLLKRGFRDGWRGLIAAGLAGNAVMLKHAFIAARKHGSIERDTRVGAPPI